MDRYQQIFEAKIADGETVSNEVNVEGYAWMIVEVPSGDEADAVTIQVLSGDGSTWIDALTLADTSNQIKGLSSDEIAAIGPMRRIKVKLGSAVSGDKTYYLHLST